MSYVYPAARELAGKPKVGDQECVALVRHFTHAPNTAAWKQGAKVLGNRSIPIGTAIATFERGRWPGRRKGNHSALYLGQVSDGIYVIDQWPKSGRSTIAKRFIAVKRVNDDGSFEQPSDNAAAFSVIE